MQASNPSPSSVFRKKSQLILVVQRKSEQTNVSDAQDDGTSILLYLRDLCKLVIMPLIIFRP